MILYRNKPVIEKITIFELGQFFNIFKFNDEEYYGIDDIIKNGLKTISILHDVKIIINDKFLPTHHMIPRSNLDYFKKYHYKNYFNDKDANENFRMYIIECLLEKFPNVMNKIKAIQLKLDIITFYIFCPYFESVEQLHLKNKEVYKVNGKDVYKCFNRDYYKNNIFYGSIQDRFPDNEHLCLDHCTKSFPIMKIIYCFMIINYFDLPIDIAQYIKLFYHYDETKNIKIA
jgi:hypothetical protein